MNLWTTERLAGALEAALDDEAKIEREGEAITATFDKTGGIVVVMSVEGEQMLASTLLWKRSDIEDAASFDEQALRTHKVLPLSTIGITTLNGEDWYELFGALSASSTLDNIVLELNTLVHNALDLADGRAEGMERSA